MSNPFDFFAGIFVINLARDTERLANFSATTSHLFEAERFEAITHSNGQRGCGMSHVAILKEARKRKLPRILVFEDDAQFIDFDAEILNRALSQLGSKNPWDVLRISYSWQKDTPPNSLKKISDELFEIINAQENSYMPNFACVGYNAGAYNTIIDNFRPAHDVIVDRWIPANVFHCLYLNPCMVIQSNKQRFHLPQNNKFKKFLVP